MKKKIIIHDRYGVKEKEIDYIPVRFMKGYGSAKTDPFACEDFLADAVKNKPC